MKTPVNKATVNNAKQTKIATIIKAEMNLVLRKRPFTMKKRLLLFFVKFLVNNYLHALKLALNKSMRASDHEQGISNCGLTKNFKGVTIVERRVK